MIQFCDRIIRYTARVAFANNFLITKEIFEKALTDFCKWLCISIYPKDYLAALIDYGKLEIIDGSFAEYNSISLERSREVLDELTNLGALKRRASLNGDIKYKVTDPRVEYIINSKIYFD